MDNGASGFDLFAPDGAAARIFIKLPNLILVGHFIFLRPFFPFIFRRSRVMPSLKAASLLEISRIQQNACLVIFFVECLKLRVLPFRRVLKKVNARLR
jgi:hypothetical protein